MPPKNTPENNDLDFTQQDYSKPEDKTESLRNQIAAADRGIALATSLGDQDRAQELQTKKRGFEEALSIIEKNEVGENSGSVEKGKDWDAETQILDDDGRPLRQAA